VEGGRTGGKRREGARSEAKAGTGRSEEEKESEAGLAAVAA
jgi:hypothetical protein